MSLSGNKEIFVEYYVIRMIYFFLVNKSIFQCLRAITLLIVIIFINIIFFIAQVTQDVALEGQ